MTRPHVLFFLPYFLFSRINEKKSCDTSIVSLFLGLIKRVAVIEIKMLIPTRTGLVLFMS